MGRRRALDSVRDESRPSFKLHGLLQTLHPSRTHARPGAAAVEPADKRHITEPASVSPLSARESIALPKPRESAAKSGI
jgi:hypothetical protein